ncbi:hypothetical protein BZG36_01108 [Bifiguratus adelaidae]|uniref:Glycosyl hydrolase family 32 C-terminal domain-containing protein n=1 Tax=Bifiguratus adelaidae TaxID=1938954 RepID=A0A261Y601_9FUNG|nr:hypothetical protein BZG36_01108 [Bifiguratus adelaidae]
MLWVPLLLSATLVASQTPSALPTGIIQGPSGNATFDRYRPRYHFMSPKNWMNDPCGPYYDHSKQIYHWFYQYDPYADQWGNITWGHATSKDMLTWTDEPLALVTDKPYDHLGVFTGSTIEKGLKGFPTIMYTSVSSLPISWTINYTRGSETQSVAWSEDGGMTWQKYASNPVIPMPPEYNVTGWRDPFVFRSSELAKDLGLNAESYFATVSSGIHQVGPRLWLYHSVNMLNWTFMGPLFAAPQNTTWSPWSGRFGFNWEVANYFTLPVRKARSKRWNGGGSAGGSSGSSQMWHIATTGSEGSYNGHGGHWPLWVAGNIVKSSNSSNDLGSLTLQPLAVGVADWGMYYAVQHFLDKTGQRRIQIGWVQEDFSNANWHQGWMACLGFLVISATGTLSGNGSWVTEKASDGSLIVQKLGTRPIDELQKFRGKALFQLSNNNLISLNHMLAQGMYVEIKASMTVPSSASKLGFNVLASADGSEKTTIYYNPSNSSINVDRSLSTNRSDIYDTAPESGAFALYNLKKKKTEVLRLHIFVDNSIVEVFANDRFALTTRVYPSQLNSTGISLFAEGDIGDVANVVKTMDIWQVSGNAWPNRL